MNKIILLISLSVISTILFSQASRDANRTQDAAKNGYSALWGRDGENWDPKGQLPDFSFAGYDMGDSNIPRPTTRARLGNNGARPNDGQNDANELQNLIDNIQTPGTIIIPSGIWNIDKRISINRSGVVIRGENGAEFRMNRTLREVDNNSNISYAFSDAFFIMTGNESHGASKRIINRADQGAKVITVESGVTYQAGDWVRIQQTDPANESLFLFLNGTNQERGYWSENDDRCDNDRLLNRKDLFRFISKVKSQSGNRVTLERPLPLEIRTGWSPKINKINMGATIQNCGIENVRIRHSNDAFAGHFTLNGSNSILMQNTVNSWIRGVEIIDCDNGVNVKGGFNCVIEDVIIRTINRAGNDQTGHHAIWLSGCSDFLVSECEINTRFIHDVSVEGSALQNVWSKIKGTDLNIDHHRVSPWANLFTEFDMGIGSRPFASSGLPCRGTHTARYATYWNLKKRSGDFEDFPYKANGGGRRELSKDYNFANGIGIQGCRLDSRSESNSQFIEFSFGETMKNPNLYLAQRAKRFSTNNTPSVTLTSPNANQTFILGDTIPLTANASDSDGTIDKVNFMIDDVLFSTDPGTPFVREFIPTAVGTYKISAIAFDNQGATKEEFVNVIVVANQKPTINIITPTDDQVFVLGDTIFMKSNASDADGNVRRVRYTVNENAPTFFNEPYEETFIPTATGTYVIKANARDDRNEDGNDEVTVTVVENSVPTGQIIAPLSVKEGYAALSIEVIADDVNNDPLTLTLKVDGQEIRSESNAPYEWGHDFSPDIESELLGLALGDHIFEVTISDGRSDVVLSTIIHVLEENTEVYEPIHDAYTQGVNGFNDEVLRLEDGRRTSYLQFDLPAVPSGSEVKSATLKLTVSTDFGGGTITAFNSNNVNWTEQGLDAGNAPQTSSQITQVSGPFETGQTYEVDVNGFTANNNKVTFVLQSNGTGVDDVSFASKENTSFATPRLQLTTDRITSVNNKGNAESIQVFPNPSLDGRFTLSTPVEWMVKDINGNKINSGDTDKIDLSSFESGIYMLVIDSKTYKLVLN